MNPAFEAKIKTVGPEERSCLEFCGECDWQPEELEWFSAKLGWSSKEKVWAVGPLASFTEDPDMYAARGICRMLLAEAMDLTEGSPYESREFRSRQEKAFDEAFKDRIGKDAALDFERKAVADLAPLAKDLGIAGKLRDLARMAKLRRMEALVPERGEDTRLGYGSAKLLNEEETEMLCLVASLAGTKGKASSGR